MAINRREFMTASSAFTLASFMPLAHAVDQNGRSSNRGYIVGASRLTDEKFAVSKVDLNGRLQWQLPLPGRGHDIAIATNQPIGVAIARRPDNYLVVFDLVAGVEIQKVSVKENLKLNGHAVWVGDSLYVTASDRISSNLHLLKYSLNVQSNTLELINDKTFALFGTHGLVGPHEIVSYQDKLYVANGGLKTTGRTVTNKSNFTSSVLVIDEKTLDSIHNIPAPNPSVSLRHLAVDSHGAVYIAGQYQQGSEQTEAKQADQTAHQSTVLLFKWDGEQLQAFKASKTLWPAIRGYIGSIKVTDGTLIATSPRAHWVGSFDTQTLKIKDEYLIPDICAVASSPSGFICGSGTGKLLIEGEVINTRITWDNHFAFSYT